MILSASGRFWAVAALSLCASVFLLWRLWDPAPLSSRDFTELRSSVEVAASAAAQLSVTERGSRCDFTEISLEQVGNVEHFQHTFMKDATRPVIIRNAVPSLAAWAQRFHMSSLADMVSAYGNARVSAVKTGPNAGAPFKTLAGFAEYAEIAKAAGTRYPVPVFDQQRPQEKLWRARAFTDGETARENVRDHTRYGSSAPIVEDLPMPDCFQNSRDVGKNDSYPATQLYNVLLRECCAFVMTPGHSGPPFHMHGARVHTLIFGSKRWAVLPTPPPNKIKSLPARTFFEKLDSGVIARAEASSASALAHQQGGNFVSNSALRGASDSVGAAHRNAALDPELTLEVLECTQHAGDVIFLPTEFFHATVSPDIAVAIAMPILFFEPGFVNDFFDETQTNLCPEHNHLLERLLPPQDFEETRQREIKKRHP